MAYEILLTCQKCNGEGIYYRSIEGGSEPIDPCPTCGGSGKLVALYIDLSDLEDKCNDIMDKCNDIMDKCNDIFEQVTE